ncbi:AQPA [Symbiodinium necroappetens]|nr:AQPA [Symbiodinium necroappetens]|mmetsp:Transcript_60620/g.144459  ORF Transcript_60620/g.144459 Transcript_60620/m.144459 type:complete len:268 (-) Transcript_60620:260-1063(-)
MEKLVSALRSVAPELVISTLFVFVSVDAAVSANHCLEGCRAHGGGPSRRLMGTPCPPPTFSVQVSLATGFAAAVASSFTYKPKGMTDEGNFGCHFNPAVTLALALRGKLRPLRAAALILAQLFASVLAAALVTAVVGLRCLQQDFDMMTQEMSPPASRVLLQAILNLLIILVALWSHERQGSMSVPVFVGFSYIAVSLVGLQQLGFDLPNILRSFGLLVIGVRNWACVWTTMLGSLSGVIIAVVLDHSMYGPEDSETADMQHSDESA